MVMTARQPCRPRGLIHLEEHDPDVGPALAEEVAVRALEGGTGEYGRLARGDLLVEPRGHRVQPRPPVGIGERHAGHHLGNVRGGMQQVAVLERPAHPDGQDSANRRLATAGDPGQDHDHPAAAYLVEPSARLAPAVSLERRLPRGASCPFCWGEAMRLPRVVCAAGSCALAIAGTGAAAPVAASPAPPSATVLIAPDIVSFDSPAATGKPPTTAECEHAFHIACYSPLQIRQAYGIPKLLARGVNGRGQTIVIVDSFGSPTVRHDLAVFDATYQLPPPPALTVIQPAGRVPPYQPTANREGWAGETSLDVEYAHAMAPGAKILLVETPTSENEGTTGFPQIVKAEEFVISHHLGGVISQSFSTTEETFPSKQSLLALRGAYIDAARKGVTVLAASGDTGAAGARLTRSSYYLRPVTSWPDSDPLVTGVGGTQLRLSAAGQHTARDQVWNDTGNVA